jgi:hypothetical protein
VSRAFRKTGWDLMDFDHAQTGCNHMEFKGESKNTLIGIPFYAILHMRHLTETTIV